MYLIQCIHTRITAEEERIQEIDETQNVRWTMYNVHIEMIDTDDDDDCSYDFEFQCQTLGSRNYSSWSLVGLLFDLTKGDNEERKKEMTDHRSTD